MYEDITGGIQSHHFLADPELRAISNWWGLITIPLLGLVFGIRIHRLSPKLEWADFPQDIWMAFIGALAYGALLAISFENGIEMLTTITFGGVLPLIISSVFVAISGVVRGGVWVVKRLRKIEERLKRQDMVFLCPQV